MKLPQGVSALLLAAFVAVSNARTGTQETQSGAVFKSNVELVTISAVVRNRDGRLVSNLTAHDFDVLDNGVPTPIVGFRSEPEPLSIAVLFDVSGSMRGESKLSRARDAAHQMLSWLDQTGDEAALFAFDTELRQLRPFGKPSLALKEIMASLEPFGATSLRDAIAAAAQRVTERGRPRRAVVVMTDGVDTASRMTAAQVSTIAAAIDVPVYILATVSPVDHAGEPFAVAGATVAASGELADLARWTGGAFFVASLAAHVSVAVRQIVSELRQQYLIAVKPHLGSGWHPLEVRARDKRLSVRARSGYFVNSD